MRKIVLLAAAAGVYALSGCNNASKPTKAPDDMASEAVPFDPDFRAKLNGAFSAEAAFKLWHEAKADSQESEAAKQRMSELAINEIKEAKTLEDLEPLQKFAPSGTLAALEYVSKRGQLSRKK